MEGWFFGLRLPFKSTIPPELNIFLENSETEKSMDSNFTFISKGLSFMSFLNKL